MGLTIFLAMMFCLYKMTSYLGETSRTNDMFNLYGVLTVILGFVFLGAMLNAEPGMFWHWTPIEKIVYIIKIFC